MKLYMHWGEAWDLMFRSFLVFIFFGLLWLKYIDPTISCLFGFPVPVLLAVAYFYRGWRKAKLAWLAYPQVEKGMSGTREDLRLKLSRLEEADAGSSPSEEQARPEDEG